MTGMYKLQPYYEGSIRFDDSFLNVLYRLPKCNDRAALSYEMLQGIFLRGTNDSGCAAGAGSIDSRFAAIEKRAQDLSTKLEKLDAHFGSSSVTATSSSYSNSSRLNEAEILIECDARNVPYSVLLLAAVAKFKVSLHLHSTLIVRDNISEADRKVVNALQSWLKKLAPNTAQGQQAGVPEVRVLVRETPVSDVFLRWKDLQISGEVNLLRFLAAFGNDSALAINSEVNSWLDAAESRFALASSRDRATFLKSYAAYLESSGGNSSSLGVFDAYVFTLILRSAFDRSSCPRRVTAWFEDLAAKHAESASLVTAIEAAR